MCGLLSTFSILYRTMDRFKSKLSGFGTITKSGEASGAASGSHDGDEKVHIGDGHVKNIMPRLDCD